MPDMEVDFPRGGALETEEKKRKKKKQKTEARVELSAAKESDGSNLEGVWNKKVTSALLTEHVLGLGVVKQIHDARIEVESGDGVVLCLPATNINDANIDSSLTLSDLFVLGEMIAFKVLKPAEKTNKSHGRAVISVNPKVVNTHLVPSSLINGLVLNASVQSIEDKGVIVDLGLRSSELKGFLPSAALPQHWPLSSLVQGKVLLVRIQQSTSTSKLGRVVTVSGVPEMETIEENAVNSVGMLMPGTMLRVQPVHPSSNGVIVALGNGLHAEIRKQHLPPRLREDVSRLVSSIRVTVLFCQLNTPMLVLSAHPDILAISKPHKRTTFQGISIGDIIECTVNEVDRFGNVYFTVHSDEGSSASLISAFASKTNKQSIDKALYSTGSVHQARVLSYRLMQRQLIVSTKKDVLTQKMVSLLDAKPGDKVKAKVTAIKRSGLLVKLYERISGFIPLLQLADKQLNNLEKHFIINQSVQCRVLEVDAQRNRLILTAKPSLVDAKTVLVQAYSDELVGVVAVAFVRHRLATGALLVGFYAGVTGLMLPKEAAKLGDIKQGSSVQVRIHSVDAAKERMLVTVADPSLMSDNAILRANAFNGIQRTYKATLKGVSSVMGDVKQRQRIDMHVAIDNKTTQMGWMSVDLLSDNLDPCIDTLSDCFKEGTVFPQVSVLAQSGAVLKVTSKSLLIDWLHTHAPVNTLDELSKGMLVCGTVTQCHPSMGHFVELAGGCALVAPARFVHDKSNKLEVGQSVIARVSSVDVPRQRFSVILDPWLCVDKDSTHDWCQYGAQLLEWALKDIAWCMSNLRGVCTLPLLGSGIVVTVLQALNDTLIVQFNSHKGYARHNNFPTAKYTRGESLQALLLDVALPSCEFEVYIIGAVDATKNKKANNKTSLTVNQQLEARVVVVKRDLIATVTSNQRMHPTVVYIPSRFHPNLIPTHGRFDCGNVLKVVLKQKTESTWLGLAVDDQQSASLLLTAPKTNLQGKEVKKVKPFQIYTAKVIGLWSRGRASACAVQLEMPDGSLGRLHACELDEHQAKCPAMHFVNKHKGERVNVKVIGITSISELTAHKRDLSKASKQEHKHDQDKSITSCIRVAECSMRKPKLLQVKKKQSLLGYAQSYVQGELVPVFVQRPLFAGVLHVEASPLFSGIIQKQNLGMHHLIINPTDAHSALIDTEFEPGQLLNARVIGTDSTKKRARSHKSIELTLADCNKQLEENERVLARVMSITHSPSSVLFALANGHRAVITPTGITACYTQALDHITDYQLNEVYMIHVLRFDDEAGRWLAVSQSRFDDTQTNSKHAYSALIRSAANIEDNSLLKGFVRSVSDKHAFIELAPGITGRIESRKSLSKLQADQLITVRVLRVFSDGALSLLYMGAVTITDSEEGHRKRTLSTASTDSEGRAAASKKWRMAGFQGAPPPSAPLKPMMTDPGLDWSVSGFTAKELAAVAKLCDASPQPVTTEHKPTSSSRELAVEKALDAKEKSYMDNTSPQSISAFDRLLSGNQNSSQLWIRYMSMFAAEKDIDKARATAERALSLINYREQEDIFNVWTAYLNLEQAFGTAQSLKDVFTRAVSNTDALNMYKQMLRIYQNHHSVQEADALLEQMLSKFRHEDLEVWYLYAQHLMSTQRCPLARQLLKRAIKCLDKQHHVTLISRFAQMEYKSGDREQGKTLFESLLNSYPRKVDIWTVYLDMLIKQHLIDDARLVFERVTSLKWGTHKMSSLYKKWISMEHKHGTQQQLDMVKQRAVSFVDDLTHKMDI